MSFISIQEALEKKSSQVKIHGWVYRERKQKDLVFLIIRDHSNIIQTVIKKENVSEKEWGDANKILVESSVELEGEIKEDKRAITGYEIQVKKLDVVGFADVFPIKKDQSEELLLDNRHLWLRSRKLTSILKIRSTVFGAIHEYFRKNNFFEHQSPSFAPNACEGGSTLFKVDYFGKPMYLTQSWQLYAEAVIFALEKKFPRITYDESLKLLAEKQNMKVKLGKDLRTIEEEKLVQLFDIPIFVTHYPKEIKAFYMLEDPKNSKVVLGFDCLAPEGYGEIIGGSERESNADKIIERLKQQGEKPEDYAWYLELRKFGSVPHSGFGMGVERVITWICKLDNIKDAIAFPRTMVRYTP